MFTALLPGTERLVIQPIIVPRRYDKAAERLHFYVVFTFIREGENDYHPCSQRLFDPVELPACLAGKVELPQEVKDRTGLPGQPGQQGYWPKYIQALLQSRDLKIELYRGKTGDELLHSTDCIRVERSPDLARDQWTVDKADVLWEKLITPLSLDAKRICDTIRSRASDPQFVALQPPPATPTKYQVTEIDPQILLNAQSNPWSASDLRPGLRVESINTRRVVEDVRSFVVGTGNETIPSDPTELFLQANPKLLAFVEKRDPEGKLLALFRSMQRPPAEDPFFHHHVLPKLRETLGFKESMTQLLALRNEFLLGPSRSEFLRQTRFVESARHRVPQATATVAIADPPVDPCCFESQLARLRQHPGLMRRLYLTVACSIAWDAQPAASAPLLGNIALCGKVAGLPLTCLPSKTYFSACAAPGRVHFRPAPEKSQEFYGEKEDSDADGLPGAQGRNFQKHHTLSTALFDVSQDDPSLAMLRASQDVSDAHQTQEDSRLPESTLAARPGPGGIELNKTPHRINALNLYHRDPNDKPFAETVQQRLKQDVGQLMAFNSHVREVAARVAERGLFSYTSLQAAVAEVAPRCPPLFYAENLMQGLTVLVQTEKRSKTNDIWRSLNRRCVKLSMNGYVLEFEEESCIALSVVVPPRPLTGTIETYENKTLTLGLLSTQNTLQSKEPFTILEQQQDPADDTRFASGLQMFFRKEELQPKASDMAIVALRGREEKKADHPRTIENAYLYPVLRAKFAGGADVFADRVGGGKFLPFRDPTVLLCRNEIPGDDSPRPNFQAAVIFAPHFTRLVDHLGKPIEPTGTKPVPAPPRFEFFTAETTERNFAQTIGDTSRLLVPADQAVQSKQPPKLVLTGLGPVNQVLPQQLGKQPVQILRIPDPSAALEQPGDEVNPLRAFDDAVRDRLTMRLAYAANPKLQMVRGWVKQLGFVFVMRSGAAQANQQAVKFQVDGESAASDWHLSQKLVVNWLDKDRPVELAPLFWKKPFKALVQGQGTAIVRGSLKVQAGVDSDVVKLELIPDSVEFAVGLAPVQSNNVDLRWSMELVRLDGGQCQVQYDVNQKFPKDLASRCIHPLDAQQKFVELAADNVASTFLTAGMPQRLLGTIPADTNLLLLPSGFGLTLSGVATHTATRSGFMLLTAGDFQSGASQAAITSFDLKSESLLVAGEVTRVSEDDGVSDIQLTDAQGQVWAIRGQGELDLPLPQVAGSVRKVRNLLQGEWLVANCHLTSGQGAERRIELAADASKLAQAQTFLWGTIKEPNLPALAQAAEGAVQFRPCSFRSVQGRELIVWTDSPAAISRNEQTAWSLRLILAQTLTQYVTATAPAAAASGDLAIGFLADEPPQIPQHLMFSDLFARWANWSLGLPQPGRADEVDNKPACNLHYNIQISRPRLDATFKPAPYPFDLDSWKLPAQRFGRSLRVCVRRCDLAGNHWYDEQPLPVNLPAGAEVFSKTPQSLLDLPADGERVFQRANLPVAPLVAFTPDHLESALLPQGSTKSLLPIVPGAPPPSPTDPALDWKQQANQFQYLPSPAREPALVLLTDVLDDTNVNAADAHLELLPPPIDVETMLMHGCLDHLPPQDAARAISRFEKYLDLVKSRALGRLRAGGELNYLPDPTAGLFTVTVNPPMGVGKPNTEQTVFFESLPQPGVAANPQQTVWPRARWLRLALEGIHRRPRPGLDAFPPLSLRSITNLTATTIKIPLPPGVTSTASISVRPADLSDDDYARMVRDHGSDQRVIKLVHATNGAWTRPIWRELAEAPRDPEAPASAQRDLAGVLDIDRLTTGACSATAYWNDPWDETVPAQHEPARAVVYIDGEGKPVECKLLDPGFGFGSQAIVQFEAVGLSFRKPTFRAILKNCQLDSLQYVDSGAGCNVLFRIYVTQSPGCFTHYSQRAEAIAWLDNDGKLWVKIIKRGQGLGPCVDVFVVAEQPQLPELGVQLEQGVVKDVRLVSPGSGRFAADLKLRITRRPPFYRVAEARAAAFTKAGGLERIDVTVSGGWYANVPHCIAHDSKGNGYGAVLIPRLDEHGGVIGVQIDNPGRGYSPDVRIEFYNQLTEIPEQEIEEPTAQTIDDPYPFKFSQPFPNPYARRVDYFARALSRFRRYLKEEDITAAPGFKTGTPPDVRYHVPRLSPYHQLEIASHIRPDKLEVRYMVPAFDWQVISPQNAPDIDPQEYFATREQGALHLRRDSRIRVYMERPWHGTGPEQLAVVVAPAVTNTTLRSSQPNLLKDDGGVYNPAATPPAAKELGFANEPVRGYALDDNLRPFVTRWGYDPVWNEQAFPPVTVDYFSNRRSKFIYDHLAQVDTPPGSAITFRRPIWLALHEVHFDSVKDMWYSDIELNVSAGGPTTTALPFLRLSLARYQENGLVGKRLSPVTLCDMYKMYGRRDLQVSRHHERKFAVRLRGEFDQTPKGAPFPKREVVVRLEARDPELSADVVHYSPPGSTHAPGAPTTGVLAEYPLTRGSEPDTYESIFEIPREAWSTAKQLHGKESIAVLSVLEFEIFPTAESQADLTGTEVLILENRLCARRLVYAAAFRLSSTAVNP